MSKNSLSTTVDDRIAASETPLGRMVASHKDLAWRVFGFSAIINILTLSVSLYLMQVYDRVLTSQSIDTLYFLTLAVMLAIVLSSLLEAVRLLIASRAGTWISRQLGPELLERTLAQRLTVPSLKLEALRELNGLKSFISTPAIFSVVDMVWTPIYLIFVFLLHPTLGWLSFFAAGGLLFLAFWNDRVTRKLFAGAQTIGNSNLDRGEGLIRNAEVIDAMGMAGDAVKQWADGYQKEVGSTNKAQEKAAWILAASKFTRNAIQVALLAVGAVLVLNLELTGGAMIASSILVGRLLMPIESSISQSRQFVLAWHSFKRLNSFFMLPLPRTTTVDLPAPVGNLSVSGVTFVPPGLPVPVLRNISFDLPAGDSLAIIGPSASGKTTLARLLMGTLRPSAGNVRLDGADVFAWKRSDFGRYVGYLPQDIELFPGTIFSNIARFKDATSEQVIAAAQLAGCHDLILHLPRGYDTQVGEGGTLLSGGQRQRIGLARALFDNPKLVVLDEPNSNLDHEGETALIKTMERLKKLGVTLIVVAHRSTVLQFVDKILVLQQGRMTAFGKAQNVMRDLQLVPNTGAPKDKKTEALPGKRRLEAEA